MIRVNESYVCVFYPSCMSERSRLLKNRIEFCRTLLSRGVDARQAQVLLALVRGLEKELAEVENHAEERGS